MNLFEFRQFYPFKPHEIVYYNSIGDYESLVEVISYPYEEYGEVWIQVREPGEPSTVETVKVKYLRKQS